MITTTRAILNELNLPTERWYGVLPFVEHAINARKGPTGKSPAELIYVYPPMNILERIRPNPSEVPDADARVEEAKEVIENTIKKLQCARDSSNASASPPLGNGLVCHPETDHFRSTD